MSVTTYTYLEDTIQDRLVPMLKEVGAVFTPAILQVTDYAEPRLTPPYWWVYVPPQIIQATTVAHLHTETYVVALRAVVAQATAGFDGQYPRLLYRLYPTLLNYLRGRRALQYQLGQDIPRYFDRMEIRDLTGFGVMPDGSNHIGLELQVGLTFKINISAP